MAKQQGKQVLATRLASGFRCVGPSCEDTCCAGWIIEVDDVTYKKYRKKYDLIDAAEPCGESGHAMCCDKPMGMCSQNQDGWCKVQQRYGADYLSDTCYFFPRSLRRMGTQTMMGASLSCPEAARMALYEEAMFSREPHHIDRDLKLAIENLPDSFPETCALALHQRFVSSLEDTSLTAEQHIIRLIDLCYALEKAEYTDWERLANTHLNAPPPPLPQRDEQDALRVLHHVLNIAVADHSQYRPRLYQTIRDMEKAFEANLHWTQASLDYSEGSLVALQSVTASWRAHGAEFRDVLRNWVAAFVSNKVLPFGGLGKNPREEIFLLAVHFITVKLALACACHREGKPIAANEVVRIVQSIARVYDHITDAQIFFSTYDHPAWQDKDGLSALVAW